jgi:hypothetical protein
MSHWRTTPCLILLSAALIACGGDSGGAAGNEPAFTTAMSSSGDTIVARTTGEIPDSGTHRLQELWRVGDAEAIDSTITFGRVDAFAVNNDNTVAVFDGTAPTLRLFDVSGRYVRTLGRKGAGPGEYVHANGLAFLQDGRLAIWDAPTSRITLFTQTGEVDRAWQPPMNGWQLRDALLPVKGHAWMVRAAIMDTARADNAGPPAMRGAYFMYDTAGRIVDTVLVPIPKVEPAMLILQNETRISRRGVPFASGPSFALLADGRRAMSEGDGYRIDLTAGATTLRIERDAAAVPVNDGERDEQRALAEREMTSEDPTWRWNGPPIPSVKPQINRMQSGADARLWVRVSAPGERIPEAERDEPRAAQPDQPPQIVRTWREPVWYDVFETDGRFLGRVVMPARSTWLGARGDLVWGVTRDENDVPFLTQWRISPAWSSQ